MSRFEAFLSEHRRIEAGLRKLTGLQPKDAPFSRLINTASQRSIVVRKAAPELEVINDLRNALTHKGWKRGQTIAEPTEEVINGARQIADLIVRPPRLPNGMFHDVKVFDVDEPLGKTLQFMLKNAFSQVPVSNNGKFESLLTVNSIARWLGKNVGEEIVEIKETPLSNVLPAREINPEYEFCRSQSDCEAVIQIFHRTHENGKLLQAVLLTDSGKTGVDIRGIVTAHDLGLLYGALTFAI